MCEFCTKHGEGRKWYLEARNYSDDLLSDLKRRKYVEHFISDIDQARQKVASLDKLAKAPKIVQHVIKSALTELHYKPNHFGQVVPIEEIERIFEFVNSVVRMACYCRHVLHREEARYCYGVSMGPNGGKMADLMHGLPDSFLFGPESKGLEVVEKDEALAQMRKMERRGLCHTVWTFQAPFIGAICNCDGPDCLAMKATVTHELKVMFRGEYVATNDPTACKGCRQCMRVCQFGAIQYSAAHKRSSIDPRRCYGCGICRSMCKQDAIRLLDRQADPIARAIW